MCIKNEFQKANSRLIDWAKWNREGGIARELELPSQSAHLNLPGGSFNSITGDEKAEQIDRMLAELKKKWSTCGKFVETYYTGSHNVSSCTSSLGVSRKKFDKYFYWGMAWIERGL